MNEWINLVIRWMHLIAGISWIGSSFFFMWLDSHLEAPPPEKKDVSGELWMVHSGGFYQVEKYRIKPGWVPDNLHWFKWEATFTWITGFFLLGVVYYMGGALYLINPESSLPKGAIMAIGLLLLPVSWVIYDFLWNTLFKHQAKVGGAVSFLLTMGAAYGLSYILSGRALFIHIGAMFGTLMVTNVWIRILPAQQQMMISNHFPSTYGNTYNWAVLAGMILVGAGIRHFMNVKTAFSRFTLSAAIAGAFGLFFYTAPPQNTQAANTSGTAQTNSVSFAEVQTIMQNRCVSCHAQQPTDEVFKVAPLGAMFDTPERIKGYVDKIKALAVDAKTMPLGNKTGMTDAERATLGLWIDQGANIEAK
jgi:uncharacterized membrane protein